MFILKFKTSNASFKDFREYEVERILKEVASKIIRDCKKEDAILDINGNTIGYWELK
jgi:hypothetical protein